MTDSDRASAPVRASGEPQKLFTDDDITTLIVAVARDNSISDARDLELCAKLQRLAAAALSSSPAQENFAKDIAAIVSSYGWLLMRLAVTSDPQDTYDVCKREFDKHQPALKRLQDAFIHHTALSSSPVADSPTPKEVHLMDVYDSLGVRWGDDVFTAIARLKASAPSASSPAHKEPNA